MKLVSEKRTQVYFPMELYREIESSAKNESKSVASVIREAIEKYLSEKEINWTNDPFLNIVGIANTGIGDASEKHDKYLYGKERKKVKR
jgi:metal-responsive CopG/Arc/MetJ family transcriptional regulator